MTNKSEWKKPALTVIDVSETLGGPVNSEIEDLQVEPSPGNFSTTNKSLVSS